MIVSCFPPSSPRLARVTLDNCLPCAAALLQGFEGFPSQAETLFSLGFTCSQQAARQAGCRETGRESGGGGFVSSGNTVFSLFLTLGDKQGCWKLMGNQMLLFGCFLLFMWWLQSGVELQLRSATVTHMHTIRRQFACVFIFFSVCFIYFGNWDLSAAQGSSIPHTVFCQNRYF